MNFIISFISILAIIPIIVMYAIKKYKEKKFNDPAPSKMPFFISIIACLIIFILSCSFVIIPTNYSGVKTTFGQVSETVLHNGFNVKIPFIQKVEKVNNKLQDIVFKDPISAETSARTEIKYANITVTYRIVSDKSSWIVANVIDYEDNLISQDLVSSAVKSASKTLKDTDATNRTVLDPAVAKSIQSSVDSKYGTNVVNIVKGTIIYDSYDLFNKIISFDASAESIMILLVIIIFLNKTFKGDEDNVNC